MQTIIAAIEANRLSQPQQIFRDRADILSTPALSLLSPWLNMSDPYQALWSISDEAYEKIPSQLLQRLRSDSIGSVTRIGPGARVRFQGMEGQTYAVEASSDLSNWTRVATNYPLNGVIEFTEKSGSNYRWYRSVLLGNN